MTPMKKSNPLPDITSDHTATITKPLQWVGMEEIAVPIQLSIGGEIQQVAAKAALYVSLDQRAAKGIHMSRLHLACNKHLAGQVLDRERIDALLNNMIRSQEGISYSAKTAVCFDVILKKAALQSSEYGFQAYPVALIAERINDDFHLQLQLTIPYSSTCPCSAALARQLYGEAIDKQIDEQFGSGNIDKQALITWIQSEAGSIATPHSQRSYASIKLSLADGHWPDISALVFRLEELIGTPVQTAVKRQDEQAFARLNAENLMFCEDAARRIKNGLEQMDFVSDYWLKVEHQESLHAHNAVVIDKKNHPR